MAEAVYVHVGAPKTGTTYLQDTLWANRDALGADGVLVPGGRRFAAFHAAQAIREVPWLSDMPAGRRDVWNDMRERIGEWPGVAVLSHEFLGAATADQAAAAIAALEPADVHVVLTARDYVSQVPALWQEAVKMGAQRPLDAFVDHLLSGSKKGPWGIDSIDAVGVLGRWGATVPAARVHVVTVPPPGSPPGLLWQRFAAVCGIDPLRFQVPDRPANESLGVVETELVRLVGRRLPEALQPKRVRYRWLRGYFAHEVLAGRGGQRPTLSPDTARRVREWGEASVHTLAERGYTVHGNLDELLAARLPDEAITRPGRRELLGSAVVTIGELIDRQRLLVERVEHLEREIELLRPATPARSSDDTPDRRRNKLLRRRVR
jgi:hypothetical protein